MFDSETVKLDHVLSVLALFYPIILYTGGLRHKDITIQ